MNSIIRNIDNRLALIARCALFMLALCSQPRICAEPGSRSPSGTSMIFESGTASRVVEKVRSAAAGVIVEIFVEPGDIVIKGQILGHTDLDATKLQLDIAKSTLEAQGNVEAARGQAEAWTVTRRETEESLRKRKVEKIRLEWASAMEEMYRGTYEVQLDAKKTQEIQYAYWKEQYEKRFIRATVDGVVSEILTEIGNNVSIASHVFTIRNDSMISIPVKIPTDIAHTPEPGDILPICPAGDKTATPARVDSIISNPNKSLEKTARLFVLANDFPAALRAKLIGMKFEVLVPILDGYDAKSLHSSRR